MVVEDPCMLLREEIGIARSYAEKLLIRMQKTPGVDPVMAEYAWLQVDAGYAALIDVVPMKSPV